MCGRIVPGRHAELDPPYRQITDLSAMASTKSGHVAISAAFDPQSHS